MGSYFLFLKRIKKISFKTRIFKKRLKFFEKINSPIGFRVWFFKVSNKGKFFFVKKKFKFKKKSYFLFKPIKNLKKKKTKIQFWFRLKKKIKIIGNTSRVGVSKKKKFLY